MTLGHAAERAARARVNASIALWKEAGEIGVVATARISRTDSRWKSHRAEAQILHFRRSSRTLCSAISHFAFTRNTRAERRERILRRSARIGGKIGPMDGPTASLRENCPGTDSRRKLLREREKRRGWRKSVASHSCEPSERVVCALREVAPAVGFEPTTNRLTADRSTTELRWISLEKGSAIWRMARGAATILSCELQGTHCGRSWREQEGSTTAGGSCEKLNFPDKIGSASATGMPLHGLPPTV